MRAGLVATELARRAGLDAADRTVVYYATLLRYAGCAPKPARASSIVERPPALPPLPADLTERELEVMRRLVVGRTKRQVAAELVISPSTVRTHTVHIYGKCGVSTRAGLAMFAMRHGLAGAPKID